MTLDEAAVILFGLFGGYWVVSKMFFSRAAKREDPASPAPASLQPMWYDVLQVPPSATPAAIRDAYKHLIAKYHPDKVDSLGQELKDLAERKSQEIIAAYREGMRERGEDP